MTWYGVRYTSFICTCTGTTCFGMEFCRNRNVKAWQTWTVFFFAGRAGIGGAGRGRGGSLRLMVFSSLTFAIWLVSPVVVVVVSE